MKCPNCGIENPPAAERCDCGHFFVSGAIPPRVAVPNQKAHESRKKFLGIAVGVTIGAAILYSVSQPTRPAETVDTEAPRQAASADASPTADEASQANWLSQEAPKKTRTWPANATVGSITNQIAREHGLSSNVDAQCRSLMPGLLEQRNESDHVFLSNTVMACGPRANLHISDKAVSVEVVSNPRVDAIPENIRREIYIRHRKTEARAMKATDGMPDDAGDKLYDKIVKAAMRSDGNKYHLTDGDLQDIFAEGAWKKWPTETAEEIKAQQDEQLVKAGCREVYRATSDKAIRDLTVNEARQVDACEVLGLYK